MYESDLFSGRKRKRKFRVRSCFPQLLEELLPPHGKCSETFSVAKNPRLLSPHLPLVLLLCDGLSDQNPWESLVCKGHFLCSVGQLDYQRNNAIRNQDIIFLLKYVKCIVIFQRTVVSIVIEMCREDIMMKNPALYLSSPLLFLRRTLL